MFISKNYISLIIENYLVKIVDYTAQFYMSFLQFCLKILNNFKTAENSIK